MQMRGMVQGLQISTKISLKCNLTTFRYKRCHAVKVLNDTAPGSNTWKEVIRLNQAYCDFRDAHKHLGPENVFMIEARIPGFLDYINEMEENLRQDAHEINGIKEMINLHRKNQQQFCEHYNTYLAKCCMKEKQGQ